MRSRLAEHNIDCTATDDPMACAKGTLLQHYFPEDKLPDRANFYVTVHVHSDDAGEEEPEVNGYEPSGSDTDGEGKNDKSAGKFRGVTIVESSVRSGRKRRRSEDRKDTYLPDRTKIIGSYSNGEFTSMQPVPIVFHVDAEGRHLGRIHTELFMSKLRFAEHTPLKDDEGNLIPGVCTYPSMFADLDDLRAKGFEVHDSNNNRPAHFEVKAFVEMAGSSDKLLLTLHVMKPDYEFPHELDDSAPTIMEEDRLFAHTQEVWSKGCSHFTSNTTGTSLSGGDGSAETAKPAREKKQRKCKKKSELSRWRAR